MRYLLFFTIFINFIALILMGAGSFIMLTKEVSPKVRANLTPIMAIFFFLYCLFLIIVSVFGVIKGKYLYLALIPFALSPFVIGYFVRYKSIKKYTMCQLFCMAASFLILLFFVM